MAWPRLARVQFAVLVFAFLGVYSLLAMYQGLARYAVVLLSLGIAVQAARWVEHHSRSFGAMVRRTTPALFAVLLALITTMEGARAFSEWRGIRRLSQAAPGAPNVVLLVLDTVRGISLSLYGYGRATTTFLETLARRGTVFDRATATSSWTLPSHGSFFTGRDAHVLSADWLRRLDNTHPTIAEVLAARGYLTAGFVANTYYCAEESGLARGFLHYEDYLLSPRQVLLSTSLGQEILSVRNQYRSAWRISDRKGARRVTTTFLDWLARVHAGERQPFFAFLNYFDAHAPYQSAPEILGRFQSGDRLRDAYDAAIAMLDREIEELWTELGRRGLLENTLLIVTSDHGEQLGEHSLHGHGNSLYLQTLQVPLLIAFPSRVPEGLRVTDPVSLRDLPSTIVDLLGVEGAATFSAGSLRRYWSVNAGREQVNDRVIAQVRRGINTVPNDPVSRGTMFSLIRGGTHYIRNGDGIEELYRIDLDPGEEHDLAQSAENQEALLRYRAELQEAIARRPQRPESAR